MSDDKKYLSFSDVVGQYLEDSIPPHIKNIDKWLAKSLVRDSEKKFAQTLCKLQDDIEDLEGDKRIRKEEKNLIATRFSTWKNPSIHMQRDMLNIDVRCLEFIDDQNPVTLRRFFKCLEEQTQEDETVGRIKACDFLKESLPHEDYERLIRSTPRAIRVIEQTDELCRTAIDGDVRLIKELKKPTMELCKHAVSRSLKHWDYDNILTYIPEQFLTEELYKFTLERIEERAKEDPYDCYGPCKHIPKELITTKLAKEMLRSNGSEALTWIAQTEELQLYAIQEDDCYDLEFEHFENPSPKVIREFVKRDPYALEQVEQTEELILLALEEDEDAIQSVDSSMVLDYIKDMGVEELLSQYPRLRKFAERKMKR